MARLLVASVAPDIGAEEMPAPSVHVLVLDAKRDGLAVRTCPPALRHRWPSATGDDVVVALDADALARIGPRLVRKGAPVGGFVIVTSELVLELTTGRRITVDTTWGILEVLDSNKDGRFNASDLAWPALRLVRDVNGNGLVDPGEASLPSSADVVSIGPRAPSIGESDDAGNTLLPGTYTTSSHATGRAADVALAACSPSKPSGALAPDAGS